MAVVPPAAPPEHRSPRAAALPSRAGDIVGRDAAGRTIVQPAVDDRVLETLLIFDADAAELESEPDEEEDGSPVLVELVRPKVLERRRVTVQSRMD